MSSHSNRGMNFEAMIEYSNQIYANKGLALVNKRPTPVKIMSNVKGRITGRLENPSTVDFDGTLLGGKSIAFEAKQVKESRFPMSNITTEQVNYLAKCHALGAICFLLIDMTNAREIFLIPYQSFKHFWDRRGNGRGFASISLDDLSVHAWEVKSGPVPVDYLPVVNKVWQLQGVSAG